MITWIKLKDEKWLFMKNGAQKELNFKQLYLWSTLSGIQDDEFIAAQMEFEKNSTHNCAEFGMFKTFVTTMRI